MLRYGENILYMPVVCELKSDVNSEAIMHAYTIILQELLCRR